MCQHEYCQKRENKEKENRNMRFMKSFWTAVGATSAVMLIGLSSGFAQQKPNILVIWGDDIGVHNISAYNHGIMGYRTPNIDRIANEGALFTDCYAQQS